MRSWLDARGVVHLLDSDALPDSTWCNLTAVIRYEGLLYPPYPGDLLPTCIVCIANAQKFYSLPNIRSLR